MTKLNPKEIDTLGAGLIKKFPIMTLEEGDASDHPRGWSGTALSPDFGRRVKKPRGTPEEVAVKDTSPKSI